MVDWLKVAKHGVLRGWPVEVPHLQKQRNTMGTREKGAEKESETQQKTERSQKNLR